MADVFISHASADVDRAREVAGRLVDAGYSVWWDDDLRSGERFQESIIRELNDARAVVVLWSAAAVASDWVYSEARRANKQDKLSQFRDAGLAIDDLPAPFDVFQCPVLEHAEVLEGVAAIVGSTQRPVRPRRVDHRRNNLPVLRVPILGREAEQEELHEALARGEGLITLTGPGGCGKTKLAVEVARDSDDLFPSGVVFVALSTATEIATAWGMVGEALGLPDSQRQRAGVLAALAEGRRLLLLDNLEQLAGAAELVDAIVEAAAGCAVLATSRRPLHVPGEREYLVPPLGTPDGDGLAVVRESGAVAMFVEYAERVSRGFELTEENAGAVAELCRRLDGLPLAIELVAVRVKFQSPAALVAGLPGLLDVASATRGQEDRQATVRRTIAWSYDLLTSCQRSVLDCLGIFEGGSDLDALVAVTGAEELDGHRVPELLYDLVDASLVTVHDTVDGRTRFRVLETVRQFARDRLRARGVLRARSEAHAQFFYDLAARLHHGAFSPEHGMTRVRFEEDVANLRAVPVAAPGSVRHPEFYPGPVPVPHLVALMASVCLRFGRVRDAYLVLGAEPEQPLADPYAEVARRLAIGGAIRLLPEVSVDYAYQEQTRALAAALPDARLPPWVAPRESEVSALRTLVIRAQETGDRDLSQRLCDELVALAEAEGSARSRGFADEACAYQAYLAGDFERALALLVREHERFAAIGDVRQMTICTNNLADVELMLGRPADAAARLAAGAEQVAALGDLETSRVYLQTFGQVIGERAPLLVAKADGAAMSISETTGLRFELSENEELHERVVAPVRALVAAEEWAAAVEAGRETPALTVLRELAAATPGLF